MADSKNAFAALEKENSASWNTASREALGVKGISNPTIISDVKEILKNLNEVSIIDFDHTDVVRHPLVTKIVKLYEDSQK